MRALLKNTCFVDFYGVIVRLTLLSSLLLQEPHRNLGFMDYSFPLEIIYLSPLL